MARLPPELRTERLLLRRWHPEDAGPLAEIYAQPEYLEHMLALDLAGTRAQIERLKRMWQEEGFGQWAAEAPATGALIGRIGLLRHHDWPLAESPVEVGWVLHRDWWRRGLATEGGRAALECWRDLLPAEPRLYSFTVPGNLRSRAVMERLGLTERGTAFWRGQDHVWYTLDR